MRIRVSCPPRCAGSMPGSGEATGGEAHDGCAGSSTTPASASRAKPGPRPALTSPFFSEGRGLENPCLAGREAETQEKRDSVESLGQVSGSDQ